jgi:uncharacterized protein YndB with AHSA1/START domain
MIARAVAPAMLMLALVTARETERVLRTEMVLAAPVAQVWDLWTTEKGVTSFFSPGARIEPRVDGAYGIYFNPSAPPGSRGGDGLRIVVFEPNKRLAFTWNAPPDQPYVRAQRTIVYVDLEPAAGDKTRLTFTHTGWGRGQEWDRAYDYFDQAWRTFVLPHLQYRVAHGPIDWSNRPTVEPVAATLKRP